MKSFRPHFRRSTAGSSRPRARAGCWRTKSWLASCSWNSRTAGACPSRRPRCCRDFERAQSRKRLLTDIPMQPEMIEIADKDGRYPAEAFEFVKEALGHAQRMFDKAGPRDCE